MRTAKLCVIIAVGWIAAWADAKTVNVFFAGGQSNAKVAWSSAIATGLQEGYGSTLVMAYTNHSGTALSQWFTTTPQVYYSSDFWNASGTGFLQSQIRAITNAGDQAVFRGVFWFQGESDTGDAGSMSAYTNRFKAMMAQLKQDFALTNDVRFCLAIIDGNPDPFYDDPVNTGGRTRAAIDTLRTNQIVLCSGPLGSYVDTRGYERSDLWHLKTSSPDEVSRAGLAMSAAYTNKFGVSPPPEETVTLYSHDADGAIFTGVFPANDLICGTANGTSYIEYNGIAFFQLPSLKIESANLVFKVQTGGSLPAANIDVWGVGYVRGTPSLSASWKLMADTDARSNLIAGYPHAPTKIADNFVVAGQSAAGGSVWALNGTQCTNLLAFLTTLYQRGALPGDYAVFRVNPDASMSTVADRNIRFGGSHQASRTKLQLTLSDRSFYEGQFRHYSHANDGTVFASGTSTANDLICGAAGIGVDYNGAAFFALPEQPLTSAKLTLTVAETYLTLVGANIDVWGLGYVSTPTLNKDWLCTNNVDERALLNGRQPFKIADNVVTSGQSIAVGTAWSPTASQATELKKWINGLYGKGAKPGDYAVIRTSIDATQFPVGHRSVRWGASSPANAGYRALLSGEIPVAENYLLNDSFEAGAGTEASLWTTENNGFLGARTNGSVRTGGYAYRMSVNGDQSANPTNQMRFFQNINDASLTGKVVTFSGYVRHNSDAPLVTNTIQKVQFQLCWLNGSATLGTVTDTNPLLPTDPKNEYKPMIVSGVVPANATGLRAQVVFYTGTLANPSITNGAAIVDDLRVTVFEPPPRPGRSCGFGDGAAERGTSVRF